MKFDVPQTTRSIYTTMPVPCCLSSDSEVQRVKASDSRIRKINEEESKTKIRMDPELAILFFEAIANKRIRLLTGNVKSNIHIIADIATKYALKTIPYYELNKSDADINRKIIAKASRKKDENFAYILEFAEHDDRITPENILYVKKVFWTLMEKYKDEVLSLSTRKYEVLPYDIQRAVDLTIARRGQDMRKDPVARLSSSDFYYLVLVAYHLAVNSDEVFHDTSKSMVISGEISGLGKLLDHASSMAKCQGNYAFVDRVISYLIKKKIFNNKKESFWNRVRLNYFSLLSEYGVDLVKA